MNARSYRVNLSLSPLDLPPIMGLGLSSVFYQSEPYLINENVVLKITNKYILTDMDTNKEHEVLSVQSDYNIPSNRIRPTNYMLLVWQHFLKILGIERS